MADKQGIITSCDRCGKEVFRERIETKSLSGGFETVENFRQKPAGWKYYHDCGMDLCPKCAEEYRNVLRKFMAAAE